MPVDASQFPPVLYGNQTAQTTYTGEHSAPDPSGTYAPAVSLAQAQQYRTLVDGSSSLTPVTPAPFVSSQPLGIRPVIVSPSETFQEILGFGAALTDSAAYNLWSMTAAQRTAILTEMFSPSQCNWSAVRISFGDTDFRSTSNAGYARTYDDNGGAASATGTADTTLANFSVVNDTSYLIPILQQIMAINPRVRVFASVWFQPPWMRLAGTPPTFDSTNYATAYANYIVKSIQAYENLGIPIYAVTPQNEPTGNFVQWTAAQMVTFIGTNLGPALDTAGLSTRIVTLDDNWTQTTFATTVLADATAGPYVDGVGWHGYGGTPDAQTKVRRSYPSKSHYFTELRTLLADTITAATAVVAGDVMIGSVRNWAKVAMLWNLALDETGSPNSGSAGRRGVITINSTTKAVTRNPEFYALTHVAKYLQPGARRCASSSYSATRTGTTVQTVAFVNPDQSVVLFAWNGAPSAQTFRVSETRSGGSFPVTMQAGEMATFVWGTTATAAPGGSAPTATPAIVSMSTAAGTGNVGSLTWPHASAPNLSSSALVVLVGLSSGSSSNPALLSMTYAGQSLTRLAAASVNGSNGSGTNRLLEVWYLLSPPAGGGNIVATVASSATVPVYCTALTLSGVNQSTPFGSPGTAIGPSAAPTATTTGGSATDLVLAAVVARTTTAPAPAAAQAGITSVIAGSNSYLAVSAQPGGTGTVTSSFTWATSDNTALVALPVHAG